MWTRLRISWVLGERRRLLPLSLGSAWMQLEGPGERASSLGLISRGCRETGSLQLVERLAHHALISGFNSQHHFVFCF